ncbi:MAG: hypothetical protein LBI70_01495, partial [Rickettsiales bacterium]|nr:hypothetical protein [Rickettsiales bacterium]
GSSAGATSPPLENSSGGGENRTGERAALLANVAPAVITEAELDGERIFFVRNLSEKRVKMVREKAEFVNLSRERVEVV